MTTEEAARSPKPVNSYPNYSPRFWHGMRAVQWWGLLARNRFRVAPSRLHIALGVSIFTPFNDLLAALQWLFYGRKIANAKVEQDPIFILGHWRSGTTLLHELMVVDPQFASPSTYQCFAAWHFLVSEWAMVRFGNFLIPHKRPMDEMEAGWKLPQEDEFALMILGAPSPYIRIAFPQSPIPSLEFLDMKSVEEGELKSWRDKLSWFMRALTVRYPKQRLIMKSPPHTGRIAELLRMYPRAKFIHLTRDPRKLFYSTLRLWDSLDEVQALQKPRSEAERRDYVWTCFTRMYEAFEAQRELIPAGQLLELRYEELVANPLETMRSIYEQLDLGDFESAKENLKKRLVNHATYRTNSHPIDPKAEQEILERWHSYAEKYNYLAPNRV
jgi:hypothetical protein